MPTLVSAKPNAVLLDSEAALGAQVAWRVHDWHATEPRITWSAEEGGFPSIFGSEATVAVRHPIDACIAKPRALGGCDLTLGPFHHPARRWVSTLDAVGIERVEAYH